MRPEICEGMLRQGAFIYALTERGVNAWWAQVQSTQRASEGEATATEMIEIARLFQAAPDLLEALREFEEAFTEFDPDSRTSRDRMRAAVIRARAAITKATTTGGE